MIHLRKGGHRAFVRGRGGRAAADRRMSQDAALREGAAALGLALSDRQCEQLLAYGALILKWNKVYNLTALRDPATRADPPPARQPLGDRAACSASGRGSGEAAGRRRRRRAAGRGDRDPARRTSRSAASTRWPRRPPSSSRSRPSWACPTCEACTRASNRWPAATTSSARAPSPRLPTSSPARMHLLAPGGVWLAMKGKVPRRRTRRIAARRRGVSRGTTDGSGPRCRALHRLDAKTCRPERRSDASTSLRLDALPSEANSMFGIADYGAFVAAIIIFLAIPGPRQPGADHLHQQGRHPRRPGRHLRRDRRRPGADVGWRWPAWPRC